MSRRATWLVLPLLLTGCGDPATPALSAAASVPPVEADWGTQVAAVRDGRSAEIRLANETVSAAQFLELATGCERLTTLEIDRADLAADDLEPLRSLPRLRWLKLAVPVDDEAAALIAGCRELEILNLPAATFSDDGLAKLAALDRLTLLRFGSPHVKGEGLKPLAGHSRLRFLHLLNVPIDDAGLSHVAAIPSLESFYLDGGRATDAGLQELLTVRPDLHFHKDEAHLPGDPNADRHD